MNNFGLFLRVSCLFILAMLLFSCAKTEQPDKRALARWEAMIGGDWVAAYAFETPGYREVYTLNQYRNAFGGAVAWESIRFVGVENIDAQNVSVKLDLASTYENMPLLTPITERWLKKEGEWWHVQDK